LLVWKSSRFCAGGIGKSFRVHFSRMMKHISVSSRWRTLSRFPLPPSGFLNHQGLELFFGAEFSSMKRINCAVRIVSLSGKLTFFPVFGRVSI
jgi:hypothetical protein